MRKPNSFSQGPISHVPRHAVSYGLPRITARGTHLALRGLPKQSANGTTEFFFYSGCGRFFYRRRPEREKMEAYDDNNVFAKILRGEIPSKKAYEDEWVYAFHDIAPQAPVHVLFIPKAPRTCIAACDENDRELLGRLQLAAINYAKQQKIENYRLVVNCGAEAGQTVFHLHLHLLAGKKLSDRMA